MYTIDEHEHQEVYTHEHQEVYTHAYALTFSEYFFLFFFWHTMRSRRLKMPLHNFKL